MFYLRPILSALSTHSKFDLKTRNYWYVFTDSKVEIVDSFCFTTKTYLYFIAITVISFYHKTKLNSRNYTINDFSTKFSWLNDRIFLMSFKEGRSLYLHNLPLYYIFREKNILSSFFSFFCCVLCTVVAMRLLVCFQF